jgi:phage shock protein A
MGIFSRLSDIVNSNLNALLDRAEDPEKIIRLIIQEMEDTLVEVRSAAVRSIAEKKGLERKAGELKAEEEDWQRKAELAVTRGRDDLAKAALHARARAGSGLRTLERQLAQLGEALARQNDAKAREQSLAARRKTAATRLKARTSLYDERITDAFARFEQVERTLDTMEGEVEAYDLGRRPALHEAFTELEADAGLEDELEALKARLGNRVGQAAKG